MKLNFTAIFVLLLLALVVVVSGCSTTPPTTPVSSNPAATSPSTTTQAAPNIADARYANNAFLISGDTLDAAAQAATSGFTINKVVNSDGSTTISLSSSNPDYQNQNYTLQPGQKLYFIEMNAGDDVNNGDGTIADDRALVTDVDGNILNMPTFSPRGNFTNGTGRFGNMTDAQRAQLNQQMTDACNGRAENDSCSVTTPNGDQNGTCMLRNSTLRCAMQRTNGLRLPAG